MRLIFLASVRTKSFLDMAGGCCVCSFCEDNSEDMLRIARCSDILDAWLLFLLSLYICDFWLAGLLSSEARYRERRLGRFVWFIFRGVSKTARSESIILSLSKSDCSYDWTRLCLIRFGRFIDFTALSLSSNGGCRFVWMCFMLLFTFISFACSWMFC